MSIQLSVSSPVIIFTAQVPLRRAIDSLYVEFQKVVFMETEPQLKPKASVAKEEAPKPSHQLNKLQIKST